MEKDLSMVIMAAGRGWRFGGLKQLQGFGPGGQKLLDYTLHDAVRADVHRAVLVINPDHEPEFQEQVVRPWASKLEVTLAAQRLDDLPVLPVGGPGPAARDKPWGTGQALWAARHAVAGPFLVANADDFYGRDAIGAVAAYLRSDRGEGAFALQAYDLLDTLPGEGGYSRGFCYTDEQGRLREIQERVGVKKSEVTGPGPLVSMNLWGFTPRVFPLLEEQFRQHLMNNGHDPQGEFYLPAGVQAGISTDSCQVQVLPPVAGWLGVTTPHDTDLVRQRLASLHQQGLYPEDLRA